MSKISKVKPKMTCCNISGEGGKWTTCVVFPLLLQKQIPRAWSKAIFHHKAPVERQGTSPQGGMGSRSSDPKAMCGQLLFFHGKQKCMHSHFATFHLCVTRDGSLFCFLSMHQPHARRVCATAEHFHHQQTLSEKCVGT